MEQETRAEVVQSILLLVDVDVSLDTIESWTNEQQAQAVAWNVVIAL